MESKNRLLSLVESKKVYCRIIILLFSLACIISCWGCFRQVGSEEGWLIYAVRTQEMVHSLYNYYLAPFSNQDVVFFRVGQIGLVFSGIFLFCLGLFSFFEKTLFLKKSDRKYLIMIAMAGYTIFTPPSSMALAYWQMNVFINASGLGLLFLGLSSLSKYEKALFLVSGVLFSQIFFLQVPAILYIVVPLCILLISRNYRGTGYFILGGLLGIAFFFLFVLDFNQYLIYFKENFLHVVNTIDKQKEIHGISRIIYNTRLTAWYFIKEFGLAFLALYSILSFNKPGKKWLACASLFPVVLSFCFYLDKEISALKGKGPVFGEFQSFEPVLFISFFFLLSYSIQNKGSFDLQLPRLPFRQVIIVTLLLLAQPLILVGSYPDYFVIGNRTLFVYYALIFLLVFGAINYRLMLKQNQPLPDNMLHRSIDQIVNIEQTEKIQEKKVLSEQSSFNISNKALVLFGNVFMLFLLSGSMIVLLSYTWISSWATSTSLIQEHYSLKKLNTSLSSLLCSSNEYTRMYYMNPWLQKAKVMTGYGPYGLFWPYVIIYNKQSLSVKQYYNDWTCEDYCKRLQEMQLKAEEFVIICNKDAYLNQKVLREETLDAIAKTLGSKRWRKIAVLSDTWLFVFPSRKGALPQEECVSDINEFTKALSVP